MFYRYPLKKYILLGVWLIIFLWLVFIFSGCTYHAPKRQDLLQQTRNRATETVKAASIAQNKAREAVQKADQVIKSGTIQSNRVVTLSTNQYNIATNQLLSAKTALKVSEKFLDRSQKLLGNSIKDQNKVVNNLLSNNIWKRKWEEWQQNWQKQQEKGWINKLRNHREALIKYGAKYEEERNKSISFWSKLFGFTLGPIVIIIVLIILFPALAPVITGLIGKVFPSFASALGGIASSFAKNVGEGIDSLKKRIKEEEADESKKQKLLRMIDEEIEKKTDKSDQKVLKKYLKEKN